jgi:energy-coupling factor transport system substrate-specific component
MSWPLASFLIVGVVLGAGWLAYEHRRPSARMAAVVAVMAALAALGRDAFAALPDVKPITAMTFVVGYALGPIPGFTVGALGMLVSNFVLGQGPYTPWQMAAWGLVGLAGAALGGISRRHLRRVPLALACGVAALCAKEVMNLYTWTLGAVHTPAAFLAVAGSALVFDLTDVIATFLFGLAFAPELARVLARMRTRMDITWEGLEPAPRDRRRHGRRGASLGAASLLAVAIAVVMLAGGSHTPGAHAQGGAPARAAAAAPATFSGGAQAVAARVDIAREVAFLARAQNSDGGFGGARGQSSSELYSAWVALGLAAAGRDPLGLRRNGHTVLDALRREASSIQGAGDLERTILALHACGVSSRALAGGGGSLVARLLRFASGDGSFGHLSNLSAFAILALRAAGYGSASPVVHRALLWLERQQNADGGFGFGARGGPSDVDDTAAALQALVAGGVRSGPAPARAGAFLLRSQSPDGGYPQMPGGVSNAQSTSWAVQGLVAAGRDPARVTREGSRSPVGYLATLLAPDGSVRYSRVGAQTPVWVTAQALTALAQRPFPIAPVKHARAAAEVAATLSARRATPRARASGAHGRHCAHPR